MNNIIFGLYNGYNSLKTEKGGIFYFMKSLRKFDNNCKVVILCEKRFLFDELISFSKEMNFELFSDFGIFGNNDDIFLMMYYRFFIYKKYLNESKKIFEKVLLTDISDVIFQESPFNINFSGNLYCALEINKFSDDSYSSYLNRYWIDEINVLLNQNNNENYINKNIICAGTIIGSYDGILKYLNYFSNTQKQKIVNDQGLLNYFVYNDKTITKTVDKIPHTYSKILTLDNISFESLDKNDNRDIINKNGEKYSIIHQINRCNFNFMLSLVG
jgi:hypothetical protein